MAFDGNGNWISNFSAEADRDAGYKILASRFDNIFIADIAQSFENCLTKDAQVKPIQPFDANNFRVINVANPSANTDAVNLATLNTKDGTAVHKAGTETISGNKTFSGTSTFSWNIISSATNTFSGSNAFSGSVSLGALATATTPPTSDNDTSVATTAWGNNFLNGMRTNCLTEIPQDINLELSNGTLTLKSGSKAYLPNGSGVFDVVTNSNDLTCTQATNGKYFVCEAYNAGGITTRLISACTSGNGATAVSGFAYDTTTNKINNYSAGGVAGGQYTFPIAIVTVSGGAISSIDQVFNGFGYIGSTVFVLPGVKGLIPNGRNSDGTLKSTSFSNAVAKVYTQTTDRQYYIRCANNYLNAFIYETTHYDEETNEVISNNAKQTQMIAGTYTVSGGKVTEFNPKPAFHAVDYSDFKKADDENVKLTGDQDIAGEKTFTSGIKTTASGLNFSAVIPSLTKGTAPSANAQATLGLFDKNGNSNWANTLGRVNFTYNTAGDVVSSLTAFKPELNSTASQSISITYPKTGDAYTHAPTPSSVTDNTTKIATTTWGQSLFANAIGTPRDVTILWGDGTPTGTPTQFNLSENFTNFEQIAVYMGGDDGNGRKIHIHSSYWLDYLLSHSGNSSVILWESVSAYLSIRSYTTTNPSTKSKFIVFGENNVSYCIFGLNRKVKNMPDPLA